MPLGEHTLGEALLAPTRIYVKTLLALMENHRIDGLAHITGGGLSENIIRVIPDGLGLELDLSAWKMPAVFQWLQSRGGIEEKEMLRTFNCGVGMVLIVAENTAADVSAALGQAGEPVFELGRVVDCAGGRRRVEYIRK